MPGAWQALISLNSMYDKLRAKGTPLATEVEFRAYHLLTLIGTHGRYGYNAAEYQNALSVPLRPKCTSIVSCYHIH